MPRLFIVAAFLVLSVSSCASKKIDNFLHIPPKNWLMESANAFVIQDKHPQAPVHLLVISKTPIKNILQASPDLMSEMMMLANRAAVEHGISEKGYRVVVNTNPQGGQSVNHLHIHVLGGRQMNWPPG